MSFTSDLRTIFATVLVTAGVASTVETLTSQRDRVTVNTHTNLPSDGEMNGPRILANCTDSKGHSVAIDVTSADDKLQDGKTYDVRTSGVLLKTLRNSTIVAGK